MIDTEKELHKNKIEKAFLIGIQEDEMSFKDALEHVDELAELARCVGMVEVGRSMALLKQINPRYLVGSGKAEEGIQLAKDKKADCILFDGELSPSQQRNWEQLAKIPVLDRQELILDIFAQRALTREAVIQVELARLQYMLPRLTRAWSHLSRQRGGVAGTRGEGEKQIEVDRRLVLSKIQQLKKELQGVRSQRDTQRKSRKRNQLPLGAIVGYTNAGKSSLLNALTGADTFVQNQLFATLDPTTRKLNLPSGQTILLTDTVGFVRRLPHLLVDAFKSTLEEATLADFLILVLDASSYQLHEHWTTTLSVLAELHANEKPMLVCLNKSDLVKDPVDLVKLRNAHPDAIMISTKTQEGFSELLSQITKITQTESSIIQLRIPPEHPEIIALAHQIASVLNTEYDDHGECLLTIFLKEAYRSKFVEWQVPDQNATF